MNKINIKFDETIRMNVWEGLFKSLYKNVNPIFILNIPINNLSMGRVLDLNNIS
jgi:hypothetical protein